MKTFAVLTLGLVVMVGTGCKKKSSAATAPSASAAPAAASAAQAGDAGAQDIPTEEDFEAKAAQQITPQNLDKQLDKLEQEIGNPAATAKQ